MKILHFFLYLFTFFPYISIINLHSELQPYSLLIAGFISLVYFKKNRNIPKAIIPILLIFMFSVLLALVDGINLSSIRAVANYASAFFITFAFYIDYKANYGFDETLTKIFIIIWFFVGFIQKYISRGFLTFLLSNSLTSVDRGVVSLAVEPTTYGIIMLFFLIIAIQYFTRNKKVYSLICVIQIIFFAQSSLAFLLLAIFIFLYLIIYVLNSKSLSKSFLLIISVLSIMSSLIYLINNFLEDTRLNQIILGFLSNPLSLITTDGSVSDRAAHIFYSLYGSYRNFLIPNGYLEWNSFIVEERTKQSIFIGITNGSRIMSGIGGVIYELGLLGIVLILYLFILLLSRDEEKILKLVTSYFLLIIMINAVPFGFPMFWFIISQSLMNKEILIENY